MRRRCVTILILVLLTASLFAGGSVSQAQGVSGKEIKRFGNGSARAIAWSPDGKQLVVGGSLGLWFFSPDLKLTSHRDNNDDEITAIAWNPNGKQIATASDGRKVQLWDVASGQFQTLDTSEANIIFYQTAISDAINWPGSIAFSPDGTRLASASLANAVKIWDTTTGKLVSTLKMDGMVYSADWNPGDARIAVGGQIPAKDKYSGFLQIWDTTTGKMLDHYVGLYRPEEYIEIVSVVQWVDSGKSVSALFVTGTGGVKKWAPEGESMPVADIGDPSGFSYAPRGGLYAVVYVFDAVYQGASSSSGIEVYNDRGEPVGHVSVSGTLVGPMTWSADGRYLAAIDEDNNVYVVDSTVKPNEMSRLPPLATSAFFARPPGGVEWSADGRLTYIDSHYARESHEPFYEYLDSVQVKDLLSGETLWEQSEIFTRYGLDVQRWALSPDHKTLLLVQEGQTLGETNRLMLIVGSKNGRGGVNPLYFDPPAGRLDGEVVQINFMWKPCWSPDSSRIAVAEDGTLAIWDVRTRKLLVFASTTYSYDLSWSPDGRYLALGYDDYGSKHPPFVVEAATGKVLFELSEVTGGNTTGVVWGPGGRSTAMITSDNQVYLWSTASGKLLQQLPGHTIEWSPKGDRLAIATEDQAVQLYHTATGKVAVTLKGSGSRTSATAFSPDNKRIATADGDGSIRIWDVTTGNLLTTLSGHRGAVRRIAWKPDGSQLLSYGDDATLRLWGVGKAG
jgi:WD40 repeat protein